MSTYAAKSISIKCYNSNYKFINEFSLFGEIEFSAENHWETVDEFDIQMREHGLQSEIKSILSGFKGEFMRYFAGSLAKREVIKLEYINSELELDPNDIKKIQLNLNHPGFYSSSIRLNSGHLYRAKCEAI